MQRWINIDHKIPICIQLVNLKGTILLGLYHLARWYTVVEVWYIFQVFMSCIILTKSNLKPSLHNHKTLFYVFALFFNCFLKVGCCLVQCFFKMLSFHFLQFHINKWNRVNVLIQFSDKIVRLFFSVNINNFCFQTEFFRVKNCFEHSSHPSRNVVLVVNTIPVWTCYDVLECPNNRAIVGVSWDVLKRHFLWTSNLELCCYEALLCLCLLCWCVVKERKFTL